MGSNLVQCALRCFFALTVSTLLLLPTPANATDPICVTMAQPVGQGLRLVETCAAPPDNPFDYSDVYYRIVPTMTMGPGFLTAADFDRRSDRSRILQSFVRTITQTGRTTSLNLTIQVSDTPEQTLFSVTKNASGAFVSNVDNSTRSFDQRIAAGNYVNVSIRFRYSELLSMDLDSASTALTSVGATFINASTQPIISAINAMATQVLNGSGINTASNVNLSFTPGPNQIISRTYEIFNRDNQVISTLRIELQGRRSLFSSLTRYTDIDASLPAGLVPAASIDSISNTVLSGQNRNWSMSSNAIAAVPLGAIPLGREPSQSDVSGLCNAIGVALSNSFALTTFDNALVRARLIETSMSAVPLNFNPFSVCFPQAFERDLLQRHLNIDTSPREIIPPSPPEDVTG